MICPECGEGTNRVIKTYNLTNENIVQRIRVCMCCGYSFMTFESIPEKEERKEKIRKTFVT